MENRIKDLEAKIVPLEAGYKLLTEKVTTLESVIEEFQNSSQAISEKVEGIVNSKNSTSEKEAIPIEKNVAVTIGKNDYTFKYPRFNYGGKDLIASNVAKDMTLCKVILKDNPELLLEVE